MGDIHVCPVSRDIYKPWLTDVHYAKRVPPVQYAYGLVDNDGYVVGVVTFGPPASPQVARSVCPSDTSTVLELNRLVLSTSIPNAASFFISRALKELPGEKTVVSYADGMMGHTGFVYQACNFYYAGSAKSHDSYYVIDGKLTHPRTLASRGITNCKQWAKENDIEQVKPEAKHRYIYFTGNKKQKKVAASKCMWNLSKDYPKADRRDYEVQKINVPTQRKPLTDDETHPMLSTELSPCRRNQRSNRMTITNYTVKFRRQMQPASYEAAEAVIEFSGVVEEGDPAEKSAEALSLAKRQVLAALGIGSKAVAGTNEPQGDSPDDKPKRGRPKKKADPEPEKAEEPAEDTEEVDIKTDGEHTEEVAEEDKVITDAELQTEASKAAKRVSAEKVKNLMKSDQFGVARLSELARDQRQAFLEALDELTKDD